MGFKCGLATVYYSVFSKERTKQMKNLIKIIGAGIACLTLCTTPVSASTYKYVNSEDGVNIRLTPEISENIVKTVGYRERLTIVETGKEWSRVLCANGSICYVSTQYLSDTQPPVKKKNSQGKYLFTATRISHYCSGSCCNSSNAGRTASGKAMQPYYTCACNGLPLGTKIYIEGYGILEVQDRLSSRYGGTVIDILVNSHSEAMQKGVRHSIPVYAAN
jgi:3D (Asp-Asp-Asp) domain-containing protein